MFPGAAAGSGDPVVEALAGEGELGVPSQGRVTDGVLGMGCDPCGPQGGQFLQCSPMSVPARGHCSGVEGVPVAEPVHPVREVAELFSDLAG